MKKFFKRRLHSSVLKIKQAKYSTRIISSDTSPSGLSDSKKHRFSQYYYGDSQLPDLPNFAKNDELAELELRSFNSETDGFENSFKKHPTSLNLTNKVVNAHSMKPKSTKYFIDANYKDNYRSNSKHSFKKPENGVNTETLEILNSHVSQTSVKRMLFEMPKFKRKAYISDMIDDSQNNKKAIIIEDVKVRLGILKVRMYHRRLVPFPIYNTAKGKKTQEISDIQKASLLMLKQSLQQGTSLTGRIVGVGRSGFSVSIGSTIRHLYFGSLMPNYLRKSLNLDRNWYKDMLHETVDVYVTKTPGFDWKNIVEPQNLLKIVSSKNVALKLTAWKEENYDRLPLVLQKHINKIDFRKVRKTRYR